MSIHEKLAKRFERESARAAGREASSTQLPWACEACDASTIAAELCPSCLNLTAQSLRRDEERAWRPIVSAPKDGTPILGYADGVQTTVYWWQPGGYWSLCECGSHADDSEWSPTHWMPLSAARPLMEERE